MRARNKKTNEIVDVIAYNCDICRCNTDNVTYIDSKGNEHDREQGLNFYWDFEPLDENPDIDWEQRRYEIAKAAMQGMLANSELVYGNDYTINIINAAINYADSLIKQLKKK